MPRFAFAEPFEGRGQPFGARLFAFGFGDPFHVFLFVAVAKGVKSDGGFRVFLSAAFKSAGTTSGFLIFDRGAAGFLMPVSLSATAFLM